MGVLRPRKRAAKSWVEISSGSRPTAQVLSSPICRTARRPNRRGSTKRSSRPDCSRAIKWVCLAISASAGTMSRLPVMPRCTIHWLPAEGWPFCDLLNSTTMCFPIRSTPTILAPSSASAISRAEDFSGWGFSPIQTDSITSPRARWAKPRATVSTSGSSGISSFSSRLGLK